MSRYKTIIELHHAWQIAAIQDWQSFKAVDKNIFTAQLLNLLPSENPKMLVPRVSGPGALTEWHCEYAERISKKVVKEMAKAQTERDTLAEELQ